MKKKRSFRFSNAEQVDTSDKSPTKSPKKSLKSSPRGFSNRKTPSSSRKPKVFGTSYSTSTSMSMLSQSLPASALATRFQAMPKPSDRIRSRYLDRLNIVKGSPLDQTRSTTAPIPTGNNRRSQEYLWHNAAADDDEEDFLDDDQNTTGDFFQLDDLDMNTNDDVFGDDAFLPLTPASTTSQSTRKSPVPTAKTEDRVEATTTKTKSIGIPKPAFSSRRSDSLTQRPIAQSFVPPHELIKQRGGLNDDCRPKAFRRKAPARSPE